MRVDRNQVFALVQSTEPTLAGHLWKQGKHFRAWRRRWCAIYGSLLFYFEHKNDIEPIGVIFLDKMDVKATLNLEKRYCFSISLRHDETEADRKTPPFERLFAAEAEEDLRRWKAEIENACSFRLRKRAQLAEEQLLEVGYFVCCLSLRQGADWTFSFGGSCEMPWRTTPGTAGLIALTRLWYLS